MKKYEIRYFLDKDNSIVRSVEEEDNFDTYFVLTEYTRGDHQTFLNGQGSLIRVNMDRVYFTKITEIRR